MTKACTKTRLLMIGTAIGAGAATDGAPGVTPQQQRMVALADPLVQKRNATAQRIEEGVEGVTEGIQAAGQCAYKDQVKNAKINRKADKDAAKAELNATEPAAAKDTGLQH